MIELQPTAEFVDYPIGNEVIRIKSDGTRCRIPDEVLQTYGGKTCYERYPDGTYRAYSFTVLYSPKPPDYVFTPEERTTFEALTARVDASIEEIKRRADSGEFTPVKGVDYFTDAEKNEMMQRVSDGAIGEFREVVDSATAGFNKNSSAKTNEYNTNAEQKLDVYNSNAVEKLEAYNQNHTEKVAEYDANAETKTAEFDANAAEKLEAYNQNHTAKVAEYNQNAETKTAEFDANAAALQTEVDRLRGECDKLAAENRKQENRISALMKLNKGQTYDILPEEGEAASRTAPSGAKYVSVDKVGGKSIVWNQQIDTSKAVLGTIRGVTLSKKENGNLFISGTATGGVSLLKVGIAKLVQGHKYIAKKLGENVPLIFDNLEGELALNFAGGLEVKTLTQEIYGYVYAPVYEGVSVDFEINPFIVDLTLMFGAGNEPTAEQFEAMFHEDSYPYNPGEIISSRTETITAGAETITTGFPELKSAGTANDVIDMDGGQIHRKIKAVRIDESARFQSIRTDRDDCCRIVFKPEISPDIAIQEDVTIPSNIVADKLATITHSNYWSDITGGYTGVSAYPGLNAISIRLQGRTDLDTEGKVKAWLKDNPLTVYYEAKSEEVTDVTIPEALQEWLPVEPGGTVTFKNADESKQLPVPNAVSWVRKLNEVE